MIYEINRHICRTYLDLSEFGCGGEQHPIRWQDVSIVLRRAGLGRLECENYFANLGCGHWIGPKKRYVRVQPPAIRYRAFDMDERGFVGFFWDDKFLDAEPGRWDGELYLCDEMIGIVKFQLGPRRMAGDGYCVPTDTCPVPSHCPPQQQCA